MTSGTVTCVPIGGLAGAHSFSQGTANTPPNNAVGFQAPTSVPTAYLITLPGAPTAGYVKRTNANPSVESVGAIAAGDLPAVPLPSPSGAFTISLPNGFGKCTTTCTITVPAPTVAGDQFCVWNGVGVSTAITLSAIAGVQYSKTDRSAYGTANTAATATAVAGNAICMVAPDTTHWDVLSSTGTWTMN
jgi:hypothetical protein